MLSWSPSIWIVFLASDNPVRVVVFSNRPVTVPLDQTFRGNAMDMPHTDPLLQTTAQGFQPQQISLSLSSSHHSVSISWITGEFQIGDNVEPLDPNSVASVVRYGRFRRSMSHRATGYSLVYSQLYPFEGNHDSFCYRSPELWCSFCRYCWKTSFDERDYRLGGRCKDSERKKDNSEPFEE
ncbi:purple acid phosphatase 15-like [Vigna radiata var. radiata]|uniref:Purple acid phosphatase 15-like n=1 Tax=Vigna radiata var. radiata TaxID=3916 RepID=A0A3Q0EPE1_VIGRR|nr:purple acid phosphatase 15-like [Vigna radiata var. radiata]